MTTPPDAKDKAARTYNAAADLYDDPSNTFWERFGRRTIDRLQLEIESVQRAADSALRAADSASRDAGDARRTAQSAENLARDAQLRAR